MKDSLISSVYLPTYKSLFPLTLFNQDNSSFFEIPRQFSIYSMSGEIITLCTDSVLWLPVQMKHLCVQILYGFTTVFQWLHDQERGEGEERKREGQEERERGKRREQGPNLL